VRKVLGRRKSAKTKAAPTTAVPGAPATPANGDASHSASQMSYDNQLGNFRSYLAILDNVAAYGPDEADLKLTALRGVATDLQAKNDAVSAAFAALSQTRGVRDGVLYSTEDSVVVNALLAKAYVNGALGGDSTLYKEIKGLQFKRAPK
jgi:hypothetical protein